jgi:hypothetical protein
LSRKTSFGKNKIIGTVAIQRLDQCWLIDGWRGDINADGAVNGLDLTLFAADWLWSADP